MEDSKTNQCKRLETGVVQVEGDWPGIFMRGDYALPRAMHLRQFLNGSTCPITRIYVESLIKTLEGCDVRGMNDVGESSIQHIRKDWEVEDGGRADAGK